MRVLVVGATGTLGSAVAGSLEPRHEVVRAPRLAGAYVEAVEPTINGQVISRVPAA